MSKYKVKVGDEIIEVEIQDPTTHPVIVTIDDQEFEVWVQEEQGPQTSQIQPVETITPALATPIAPAAPSTPDPLAVAGQPRRMVTGGKSVRAPMPGLINKVSVRVGDEVKRGDILCVLEAMKMNNQIRATQDGTVAELNVEIGVQVNYGDPLVVFK